MHTWSASVLELLPYFSSFYAKDNSDPEVVGLLFGVSAFHAEWRSVHSLSSASSLFSHLEFGHYVMSPSYLAVLVRCLGVLSWRNAWADYGYIFASSLVQFLGWSSTCSFVCATGLWSDRRENCALAVAFLVRGRCPWFAGRADSLVQVWRRQSSHTDAAYPHVFLDKVVDMPFVNDRLLHSGGASLQFIAYFRAHSSCATWTGMMLPAVFLMAAMTVFDAFRVIFRAPPAMPELSASFSSF